MNNKSLLNLLSVVLAAGLMASCMGLEDTDPSSLFVPQFNTFEVKNDGSLIFALSASVDAGIASRIEECGFYYSKDKSMSDAQKIRCKMSSGSFSADLTLREYGKTFYVCAYVHAVSYPTEILSKSETIIVKDLNAYVEFGEPVLTSYDSSTKLANVNISCLAKNGVEVTSRGICYGSTRKLSIDGSHFKDSNPADDVLNAELQDVELGEIYYVRPYLYSGDELVYGSVSSLPPMGDISAAGGSANCYIVSKSGSYCFPAVKGNSNTPVGSVQSVEVLWESFGTDVTPSVGDLVQSVSYSDYYISFKTPAAFKEGNAVIAAKDASGKILWSWHIWLTQQPAEQVYANEAGVLMDRNLGATSADYYGVTCYGLYYQWGRKDPFLGPDGLYSSSPARSTVSWPSCLSASSARGTIRYSIENPMEFIARCDNNEDWLYSSDWHTDHERWASTKTIYDPCPAGWRVPDDDVWIKAGLPKKGTYPFAYGGVRIGSPYCKAEAWYPATGYNYANSLSDVGEKGGYWTVTAGSNSDSEREGSHILTFESSGTFDSGRGYHGYHAYARVVRCFKE
ncbi:MAG: hypothetical protein J6A91_07125 [Bacteroidales bacterium]|nr:hypothetical protein [Bacteroidales bacterium]MBR6732131.1 hypothetical protein [Bacteroidales bacterium]